MIFFIIFQHEFIAAAANKNKFYNFLLGKLIRMSRLRSLARFILLFVKKIYNLILEIHWKERMAEQSLRQFTRITKKKLNII